MTRRALACGALLLLAACHGGKTADMPDADADLRAKTAAKTVADLAAADAAARAPLPGMPRPSPRERAPTPDASEPAADIEGGNIAD